MTAALLVTGSLLMLIAAIGVLRLPDVYLRMSAVSKATTLGVALSLLGAAWHFGTPALASRVLVTVVFLYLSAPVAAHRIARAAYRRDEPMCPGTHDELAESDEKISASHRSEDH